MTNRILAAATAATLLGAAPAMAADLISEPAAAPVVAAEAGDWYVSLFAGGVWTDDVTTDFYGDDVAVGTAIGYSLGLAVGTEVFDNVRAEIELSAGRVEAEDVTYNDYAAEPASGPIDTVYLLGNVWYDIDTDSGFTPYLGGGAGVGYATADTSFDGNDYGYGPGQAGFAFQLGAGVKFDVSETLAVDVGYRYKSIVGVDFEDNDGSGVYADGTIGSHVLQGGLTVKF